MTKAYYPHEIDTTDAKLCVNCVYMECSCNPVLGLSDEQAAQHIPCCYHKDCSAFSLVTGIISVVPCEIVRAHEQMCGPDGSLWEEYSYIEGAPICSKLEEARGSKH